MTRKYFGTDGIRGKAGEFPVNAEFVLKLGWAVGKVLGSSKQPKIIIGKDTRISGYMFESALKSGLVAAGVETLLIGPMPTPAIAYLTRTLRCDAGIVISASHNPYYDNGIKFFSSTGQKLPDELEEEIEAKLDEPMVISDPAKLGKARHLHDAGGRYIEYCKSTIPSSLSLKGLRIVIDCAHGATYHVAPDVFEEIGADTISIGIEPNGLNINDRCGSTYPQLLQEKVLRHRADLGVAFDGDGDRVVMVDNQGEILDGDELIYIISRLAHASGTMEGGVVGTLMTNLGLELALKADGIPFVRTKVGDRHVMEEMAKRNWKLGGESSGHIICAEKSSTGDGIVAALQVIHAMVTLKKSLAELRAGMKKYPQTMINVPCEDKSIIEHDQVKQVVDKVEVELGDNGRVLLRPSGTEPLVRVMVEGVDPNVVANKAQEIANIVEKNQ